MSRLAAHALLAAAALTAVTLFVPGLAGHARAAERGEAVFKQYCAICHSPDPGHNKIGPSLAGVVGRKAGSVPDFSYSSANKGSGIVWTRAKLDAYLTNPQAVVPGTAMLFPGIKDADKRHALIDYLAGLPAS